jgi:hypothetical protein
MHSGSSLAPLAARTAGVALAGVLLFPATAFADDDDECVTPSGDFTAVLVPPPECTSPVGFCTHGVLTGGLEATYDFVMTSSAPAPTAEHPSRVVYTGHSVVQTADGAMFGSDTGEMWFEGGAGFITSVGVIGGDECFEDVSGQIVAVGRIDLATGLSVGTYTSEICGAEECFEDDDDQGEDEQ